VDNHRVEVALPRVLYQLLEGGAVVAGGRLRTVDILVHDHHVRALGVGVDGSQLRVDAFLALHIAGIPGVGYALFQGRFLHMGAA